MTESAVFVKPGKKLFLSGSAFIQLMRETLYRGVALKFQAQGYSMSPCIRDGDVITISPLTDKPICRGDVVAFVCPARKKLVVHRVVYRNKHGELHTAGDNLPKPDTTVSEGQILGRVTSVQRNGKDITFGLGAERLLIAVLARHGLIYSIIMPMVRHLRAFFKRSADE
jgi:signal peptidase I